jgi:hypothetical protein
MTTAGINSGVACAINSIVSDDCIRLWAYIGSSVPIVNPVPMDASCKRAYRPTAVVVIQCKNSVGSATVEIVVLLHTYMRIRLHSHFERAYDIGQ